MAEFLYEEHSPTVEQLITNTGLIRGVGGGGGGGAAVDLSLIN